MPGRIADDEQRRAATQGPPGWKEAMMPQPAARIAQIPYLNVAPFLLHWDQITEASEGRWIAVEAVPRALGLAAEAGEVDAGIFPTADLLRLGDELEPLIDPEAAPAGYGIATRHRVDSVLLFLRDDANPPVAAVTGRVLAATEVRALHGATIAVTGESSTSARLLRILLEERHAVRPAGYPRRALGSESIPPEAGAVLTIGDEALRWRQRPPAGFRLGMDLAAEWGRWTNLPFVFARWGSGAPSPRRPRCGSPASWDTPWPRPNRSCRTARRQAQPSASTNAASSDPPKTFSPICGTSFTGWGRKN